MKCTYHPNIETNISCASCDKPICPKCMVYAPVGVKCPDCARHRGRVLAGAKPIYYIRALGAGLASGIIGGILLGVIIQIVPFGRLILVIFAGWAIGELVSKAAGRNRGVAFQGIAAVSALIAFFIAGYFNGFPFVNPLLAIFALAGAYYATIRLKD